MWSLLTIAYFVLAVGLHAVAARVRPAGNRVLQFLAVGSVCGGCLLLHFSRLANLPWTAWLAGGFAYTFACELHVFLFTFVTGSVSVALLTGRGDPAGPAMSPPEMVAQRLQTMTAAGLLDRCDGRLQLNRRSRLMVAVYRALRRFFRHEILPT